jgi:hypothetical protein
MSTSNSKKKGVCKNTNCKCRCKHAKKLAGDEELSGLENVDKTDDYLKYHAIENNNNNVTTNIDTMAVNYSKNCMKDDLLEHYPELNDQLFSTNEIYSNQLNFMERNFERTFLSTYVPISSPNSFTDSNFSTKKDSEHEHELKSLKSSSIQNNATLEDVNELKNEVAFDLTFVSDLPTEKEDSIEKFVYENNEIKKEISSNEVSIDNESFDKIKKVDSIEFVVENQVEEIEVSLVMPPPPESNNIMQQEIYISSIDDLAEKKSLMEDILKSLDHPIKKNSIDFSKDFRLIVIPPAKMNSNRFSENEFKTNNYMLNIKLNKIESKQDEDSCEMNINFKIQS